MYNYIIEIYKYICEIKSLPSFTFIEPYKNTNQQKYFSIIVKNQFFLFNNFLLLC